MKIILQKYVSNIIHSLLTMFMSWVTIVTGYEYLHGDGGAMTVVQFITGLVLVGLVFLMKWLDGTKHGVLIRSVVGDRSVVMAHAIARGILAIVTGVFAASLTEYVPAGELGDQKVEVIGVIAAGVIANLFYKKIKP
jgi:hypothetical protein